MMVKSHVFSFFVVAVFGVLLVASAPHSKEHASGKAEINDTTTVAPPTTGTTTETPHTTTGDEATTTAAGDTTAAEDSTPSDTTLSPISSDSPSSEPTSAPTSSPPNNRSTAPPTSPTSPTKAPPGPPAPSSSGQRFDAASFIGGIVLCGGLIAIIYFGCKFYRARNERQYHQF